MLPLAPHPAADIVNDLRVPVRSRADRGALRLGASKAEPVVYYMLERGLIVDYQAMGIPSFAIVRIVGNQNTRRFVKSPYA